MPTHPLLSEVITDPSLLLLDERRRDVEEELARVEVAGEKETEILRRVVGVDKGVKDEEEEAGVGRNVRSL